ncbi:UDP-N-acetylmuramoyl-tripeptide:D-alanyl-D-alanine ligase [Gammaproteobacteria bacterium]|nr:UDP-N-acetylmuramoyl-tripeptide:D-alanyl-D-alanine ligase [Gammaproteobacteria bacterium]
MRLSDAAKHMNGKLYGVDSYFFGAATDTRLLKAGQLFFAWKGISFDAHNFLELAASNGAVAAVVESYNPSLELPQILVKNSQKALGKLAREWRKKWLGLCFAITGSNGKTTVKEMLTSICTQVGRTHATFGNLNNHIGCPLTILALKPEHQFAVIEMGANHPKEISYLTGITKPNIAILNNAGMCHLEGFGSLQGVATSKAEIFESLAADATAIINLDDDFATLWIDKVYAQNPAQALLTFGLNPLADITLGNNTKLNNIPFDHPSKITKEITKDQVTPQIYTIKTPKGEIEISLALDGMHNICNSLAATAAAIAAHIPLIAIKDGLEALIPVKGRLQKIILTPNITLMNDSYNANPSSLNAGIDAIKTHQNQENWLILGDMRELGLNASELHFASGKYAKDAGFTHLFGLGELSSCACAGFEAGSNHFKTHEELINALIISLNFIIQSSLPNKQITLLIKGSFSMNMQKITDRLIQILQT